MFRGTDRIVLLGAALAQVLLCLGSLDGMPSPGSPEIFDDLSVFRGLESGENSEEVVNECCRREARYVTLPQGSGIEEDEVRVDLGYCPQACENRKVRPLKREEFDKFLKKYPDMDPIQIFLSLQTQELGAERVLTPSNRTESLQVIRMSSPSCSASSACLPTSTRREAHLNIYGHARELDVIESCDCLSSPLTCQKVSNRVKYHAGTPFEKTLDLGQCLGPCHGAGNSCRSVRNRTVTVEGPNGSQCQPVVEECECVGTCYRTRQFLKVYDYTGLYEEGSGVNSTEGNRRAENRTEPDPAIKEIDIGRCDGSCRNVLPSSKCLIWSAGNETCLSSLYGGQSLCAPTKLLSHFYMDKSGTSHSVVSVRDCGCR